MKAATSVIIARLSRASWFKIAAEDEIVHIDPGYTGYFENQGILPEHLGEKAHVILITHFHKDHCQPRALSIVRGEQTAVIAPKRCAERIGGEVSILEPGDETTVGRARVRAAEAYNTLEGNSTRKVHHKGQGVGYLLDLSGETIYHAGDTDFIPEMASLGKIDVALIPIGGIFVMDMEDAIRAVSVIRPRIVIPMHESRANPELFKKRIEAESETRVAVMAPGETLRLGRTATLPH